MAKPLALDFFSGGGGACIGLQQAGFEVVGVDIKPHKNYPGHFVLADITKGLPVDINKFAFVWASPPCQLFSVASRFNNNDWQRHPNLIPLVRKLLKQHPLTCIENVQGSPLRTTLVLTGPTVGLPYLQRRRHFETSFIVPRPKLKHVPSEYFKKGLAITVTKSMCSSSHFYARKAIGLSGRPRKWEVKFVMGIPLLQEMTFPELGEAIPPAYSRFIGEAAMKYIR